MSSKRKKFKRFQKVGIARLIYCLFDIGIYVIHIADFSLRYLAFRFQPFSIKLQKNIAIQSKVIGISKCVNDARYEGRLY